MQFLPVYKETIKDYFKEYNEFLKTLELSLFVRITNYVPKEHINNNNFESIKLMKSELLDFTSDKFKIYFFTYFFIYSLSAKDRKVTNNDITNFIDVLKLYSLNFKDDVILNISEFWVDVSDVSNPFNSDFLFKDYLLNIILLNIPEVFFKFIMQYFFLFQFFYEEYDYIKSEFSKLNNNNIDDIIINYRLFRHFVGYTLNQNINIDISLFKDFVNSFVELLIFINNDFCMLSQRIDIPSLLLIKNFRTFYNIQKENYFFSNTLDYNLFDTNAFISSIENIYRSISRNNKCIYKAKEFSIENFNDILDVINYESDFLVK